MLAVASVAATAGSAGRTMPAAAAVSPVVVTIQFDDGVADQYGALPILSAHGMHATFCVNTGFIGDSAHMSSAQLHDLFAAANEIAGHTLSATRTPPNPKQNTTVATI